MSKQPELPQADAKDECEARAPADAASNTRRELLAKAGLLAAATAPAMIVLLRPEDVAACHAGVPHGTHSCP